MKYWFQGQPIVGVFDPDVPSGEMAFWFKGLPAAAIFGITSQVVTLPDAATLCDSKRAKYGFAITLAGGLSVQASNGNQIRIGAAISSVNGYAFASNVGDYLELVAIDDDIWLAVSELPSGAWSVV